MQMDLIALVLIVLGLAALGIALWAGLRWQRSRRRNLAHFIRTVSWDALSDIVVPDGAGGEIHIEYLLLTPKGLLLLETKDMQGAVFAGERMDTWSASHQGKRLTFDNPITVLQERIAAISSLAPLISIDARVLFVNQATFPKGHPSAVTTLPSLSEDYLSVMAAAAPSEFPPQWQKIREVAVSA